MFLLPWLLVAANAHAQLPNPYGAPIGVDVAKKAAAPAVAEARKNNWTMAVAIVDTAGNLVYFEKMDGTQTGSVNVAIDKARTAALFKRPTKAFQDVVAAGGDGLRILRLEGATPIEGAFHSSSMARSSGPSAPQVAQASRTDRPPRPARTP